MNRKQRQRQLTARVTKDGELSFTDAAVLFGVSEMTIRRDVDSLEERGLMRRVPGGVIATAGATGYEPSFASRVLSRAREKEHVAGAAVDLLAPGSHVMIDTGSTGLAVAKAVRGRGLGLTVLTPNLLVAMQLVDEPDTSVFLTGGELRRGEMSLIGPDTVQSLTSYNLDTYVMSVAGVDAGRGISDYNRSEAATKRAAVAASDRVIVCVDASKLDQVFLTHVAALAEIDILVTDGDAESRSIKAAVEAGVTVVHVPH